MVKKITTKELNEMVKDNSTPLVIDCYADWCMPCKQSSPQFEVLSKKYKEEARFVKVNVDEQPAIANAFRVTGVPSFFILEGKKVVKKVVGANLKKLENLLKKELTKYPNIPSN
ncbi:MAG: thioredoxin family protein [Candidatus Hodarchaeales archaeon]|jgi:thioredoxin 1